MRGDWKKRRLVVPTRYPLKNDENMNFINSNEFKRKKMNEITKQFFLKIESIIPLYSLIFESHLSGAAGMKA